MVYCGRGPGGTIPNDPGKRGWLGNPVVRGKPCPVCGETHNKRGSTLGCYAEYLAARLEDPEWEEAFYQACLDQELFCFCKDKSKCHTSVIKTAVEVIDHFKKYGSSEEKRAQQLKEEKKYLKKRRRRRNAET